MLNNWSRSTVWKIGAVPRPPHPQRKAVMGRLNFVSALNAEALAWAKEEDTTQIGQVTERDVFPNKACHLCLRPSGHSMRFVKDFFFSPKGKLGLKKTYVTEASLSHLEDAEETGLRMSRREGVGVGGRAGTQGPICLQDENTSRGTLLKQSFQLW